MSGRVQNFSSLGSSNQSQAQGLPQVVPAPLHMLGPNAFSHILKRLDPVSFACLRASSRQLRVQLANVDTQDLQAITANGAGVSRLFKSESNDAVKIGLSGNAQLALVASPFAMVQLEAMVKKILVAPGVGRDIEAAACFNPVLTHGVQSILESNLNFECRETAASTPVIEQRQDAELRHFLESHQVQDPKDLDLLYEFVPLKMDHVLKCGTYELLASRKISTTSLAAYFASAPDCDGVTDAEQAEIEQHCFLQRLIPFAKNRSQSEDYLDVFTNIAAQSMSAISKGNFVKDGLALAAAIIGNPKTTAKQLETLATTVVLPVSSHFRSQDEPQPTVFMQLRVHEFDTALESLMNLALHANTPGFIQLELQKHANPQVQSSALTGQDSRNANLVDVEAIKHPKYGYIRAEKPDLQLQSQLDTLEQNHFQTGLPPVQIDAPDASALLQKLASRDLRDRVIARDSTVLQALQVEVAHTIVSLDRAHNMS